MGAFCIFWKVTGQFWPIHGLVVFFHVLIVALKPTTEKTRQTPGRLVLRSNVSITNDAIRLPGGRETAGDPQKLVIWKRRLYPKTYIHPLTCFGIIPKKNLASCVFSARNSERSSLLSEGYLSDYTQSKHICTMKIWVSHPPGELHQPSSRMAATAAETMNPRLQVDLSCFASRSDRLGSRVEVKKTVPSQQIWIATSEGKYQDSTNYLLLVGPDEALRQTCCTVFSGSSFALIKWPFRVPCPLSLRCHCRLTVAASSFRLSKRLSQPLCHCWASAAPGWDISIIFDTVDDLFLQLPSSKQFKVDDIARGIDRHLRRRRHSGEFIRRKLQPKA